MKGIYLIRCDSENKIYIGQSNNITKRYTAHLSKLRLKKHPNSYLQEAFDKYGEKDFICEVLFEVKDDKSNKQELYDLEIYYISLYDSTNRLKGYNIERGGISCGRASEETCKKLSEAHKGKKPSDETRRKLSEILKGKPSHWKGKKQTKEHSQKRTKCQIGKIWVNNGEISKFVSEEDANVLLRQGFKKGKSFYKWHTGKYQYNDRYCTLCEISRICGINRNVLSYRLKSGWSMEKATTTPIKK